jgi:outer membrane protein OmpA-like peptidoglycan-associated protein
LYINNQDSELRTNCTIGLTKRRFPILLCTLVISAIFSPAGAQSGDGSLAGTREVGLLATARFLSKEYSVEDRRSGFGGNFVMASHFRSHLAVQGGLGIAYSRQEGTYYKPPLFTFTPTLSLLLQTSTASDFQPYALLGAGYEFVRFTHPRCDCEQSKSLGIGNAGVGFRKMFSDRRALRFEVTSQIGKGGPAFSVSTGASLFVGGPRGVMRKSQPRPPERVRPEPPLVVPPARTPQTIPSTTPSRPAQVQPSTPTTTAPRPTALPALLAGPPGKILLTIDGTKVDFNKPTWRNDAEPLLDELVVDMTSEGGQRVKISVEGHTDNIGSDAANMAIGLDRARAIREHLIASGISADRIEIRSAGEGSPIAPNTTALGRQQNRRIVIRKEN